MITDEMRKQIETAFRMLGENEDEVACNLYAFDIRGVVYNAWECPVVQFLRQTIAGLVDGGIWYHYPEKQYRYQTHLVSDGLHDDYYIIVPGPVSVFIEQFDRHLYPELEISVTVD